MREAERERTYKWNNFRNSSLVAWSYLVRTVAHLASCSVSNGSVTVGSLPAVPSTTLFGTSCLQWHQQRCKSPLGSCSRLGWMPSAETSISSNSPTWSHIFCVHLIHFLEFPQIQCGNLFRIFTELVSCGLFFTPLPLGSVLNFSVGPQESQDHSGFFGLQDRVYLVFQHSAYVHHQVLSALLLSTAILIWN